MEIITHHSMAVMDFREVDQSLKKKILKEKNRNKLELCRIRSPWRQQINKKKRMNHLSSRELIQIQIVRHLV